MKKQDSITMVPGIWTPKTSRWLSTDPAALDYIPQAGNEEYNSNLPGYGGVFNSINMHLYGYAANNPVKYRDPDGQKFVKYSDDYTMQGGNWGTNNVGNSTSDEDTMEKIGCAVTMFAKAATALYNGNISPGFINNKNGKGGYFASDSSELDLATSAKDFVLDYNLISKDIKNELKKLEGSDKDYAIGAQVKYKKDNETSLHFVNVEGIVTMNGKDYLQISATSNSDKNKTNRKRDTWEHQNNKMYVELKDVVNLRVFSIKDK